MKRDAAIRERLGAGNRPMLLYTGRLVKEKDLEDLIQALHQLRLRGVDFLPVFAGEGPMRNRIEEQIPDSRILGFVHGEELSRIYASSDLFVFPSTTETFGNVVLEAFASGIPVVGVDSGGVADLISDGEDGFIARSHDPGHLALKIEMLLLQPELRIRFGLEARKKAALFSWDAINRRLIDECRDLTLSDN
jgi:glycosyltransferase involved in cell wall biosynthesis